jgi:hypothetical protein
MRFSCAAQLKPSRRIGNHHGLVTLFGCFISAPELAQQAARLRQATLEYNSAATLTVGKSFAAGVISQIWLPTGGARDAQRNASKP